jgi:signal transduction histidine kinase
MRLSIKTKQVLGVTSIVGLAVVVLSGFYLASLARIRLEESRARGELLANAIYQRAREVVAKDPRDPNTALRADEGLRSILESSAYSPNVTYAAILDTGSLAIVHSDTTRIGQPLPPYGDLSALLDRGPISQIRAIYADGGRTLEIRQPLLMGTAEFGSIHIGVSTLLVQRDLTQSLAPALITAPIVLVGASLLAMVLAQLSLRPIHVIRSGLTRLGQGEFGVVVDLPQRDEFGELGDFFNTVSARLSADRPSPATALLAASLANSLGSDKDPLEDAVAIFNPDGKLLFANPAMRTTLPPFLTEPLARSVRDLFSPEHPYRKAVEEATVSHQSRGPVSAYLPSLATDRVDENGLPAPRERLILTHVIDGLDHRPAAVMLVARNLDYMTQVRSSFSYSQKLAALSRLSAGVAHEVKNPLNATVIHLELLKQQLSSSDLPLAMEHLSIITAQIRRLDEVVQGFLRFIRPEDLKLQPVSVASMVDAIMPVVVAEARKYGVDVNVAVPDTLPVVSVDTSVLQQALMNLALNACQAMPQGGRLRISAAAVRGRRVEILCEDNGVGIAPENLNRIFDLYFTTKEGGSGIGLSLVYRAIQLVDGEIEVQSTPGRGTTFRVLLPQA